LGTAIQRLAARAWTIGPEGHVSLDAISDTAAIRWNSTARGLTFIWWGLLALIAITGALGIALASSSLRQAQLGPSLPFTVLVLAGICAMPLLGVLIVAGITYCCAAPDGASRKRALATLMSMACCIGGLTILGRTVLATTNQVPAGRLLDALVVAMLRGAGGPSLPIAVVVAAFAGLSVLFFNRFHAAIADHFQNPALQRLVRITLIVFILSLALNLPLGQMPLSVFEFDILAKRRWQITMALIPSMFAGALHLMLCSRAITVIQQSAHDVLEPSSER
jgi:hypothetical protein